MKALKHQRDWQGAVCSLYTQSPFYSSKVSGQKGVGCPCGERAGHARIIIEGGEGLRWDFRGVEQSKLPNGMYGNNWPTESNPKPEGWFGLVIWSRKNWHVTWVT
eukprot:scaffold154982_cov22-Tisochrysis_lutea.AAC.3